MWDDGFDRSGKRTIRPKQMHRIFAVDRRAPPVSGFRCDSVTLASNHRISADRIFRKILDHGMYMCYRIEKYCMLSHY